MNILIFNCGSSSLNYKVYAAEPPENLSEIASGKAHHVGVKTLEHDYIVHSKGGSTERAEGSFPDHRRAALASIQHLRRSGVPVDIIGHRFVHGGTIFQAAARLDQAALERLEACLPLAPIHNPNSFSVIQLCREELPGVPQYACFDTAFHASLPEEAYRYALPARITEQLGIRKFGFHGLSYQYVTRRVSRELGIPVDKMKMVACHLGTGGSSAAAIDGGRSVETSMGYTPLAGLIMSTRSGDIDPSIPLALVEAHGLSPAEVERLLNKDSGLVGVSGSSSDLIELVRRGEEGDQKAQLAVEMYAHRLKGYIGAYLAILGGGDVLAFTDDIGLRCWQVRELACANLEALGIRLDPDANREADPTRLSLVSDPESGVKVVALPTDEEFVIAVEGLRLAGLGL